MGLAKMQLIVPGEASENVLIAAAPVRDPLRLLEAMLFAASEPLAETELAERLPKEVDAGKALVRLQQEYARRGVNLVRVNGKWTFRTASDLSWLLSKE